MRDCSTITARLAGGRRALALLGGLALAAGCATRGAPPPPPAASLVWPPAPHPPRIAYVQSIHRPADIGDRPSRIGRWIAWLTGNSDEYQLVKPFGISLDENDNLCLTDTGARTVIFIDRAQSRWQAWEQVGKLRFVSPVAVAKRGTNLYVADSGLGRVIAFNTDGKLLFQITNHLQRPVGLALSGEHLLVADAARHAVITFDRQGRFLREFGQRGSAPGMFNFPTHLAADAQGRLYITDSMNARIEILAPDGQFVGSLGSAGDAPGFFSRPKGVATDALGHVYVVDANFDNIQTFDLQGRVLLEWGGAGSAPGRFWLPNGIAISRQNELFVTDCYNHRVQVFKYVGPP